jgi:ATP-binding cassette, subfamily B, bacterial
VLLLAGTLVLVWRVDARVGALLAVLVAAGGAVLATAQRRAPQLLVLDDVSSALDRRTEDRLWRALADAGITCLAASHRRAALERADQVVVLDRGRVVAAGPASEVGPALR